MTTDLQTLELGNAKVRLRTDLRFTLHRSATAEWYVVEDDSRGQYFRIGRDVYAFLSLLDGRRTLDQAQAELASLPGGFSLDEQHATGVAKWMIDSGLAESYASHQEQSVSRAHRSLRDRQSMGWLNPISWRLPLLNPDAALQAAHRRIGWLLSLPLALFWLLTVTTGFGMLALHWNDFRFGSFSSVSAHDAFWFAVAWLLMKVAHEAAHGITCKHFGGRVPQFGILLLLFIPLPYVDVTSSWRFSQKYQRLLTAAGMLAEAWIAALAAIVWCRAEPWPLQYHASNLILAGTVNTLLFNLNPLMRFDGYHILANWLDLPNLSTRARQAVKSYSKHLFFGTRFAPAEEPTWGRRQFVYAYGWAALGWQILVCVGLAIAAANLFPGIGLILMLLAVVAWLGIPLWRLANYLWRCDNLDLPNRGRFACISGCLLLIAGLLLLVPAPATIRAPLVVRQDLLNVRAISPGQVSELHVEPGQFARQGDLLITLHNPELQSQLQQTEVQLRTANIDAARYLADRDVELWQLVQEQRQGLARRLEELRFLVNSLQIRAQADGVVVLKEPATLRGQFVQSGDELLSLRSSNSCRAIALVAQADARWLRDANAPEMQVLLWGQGGRRIPSTLQTVHPRASFELPHAAFASSLGGPISVLDRQQTSSARDNRSDSLLASSSQGQTTPSLSAGDTSPVNAEINHATSGGRSTQTLQATAKHLRTVQPYVQVEVILSSGAAHHWPVPSDQNSRGTNLSQQPRDAFSSTSTSTKFRSTQPQYYEGQTGVLFASGRHSSLGQYLGANLQNWLQDQFRVSHGL